MVEPFIEAVRARLPHAGADIVAHTRIVIAASGEANGAYRHGDMVTDTGLRVLDRPVQRVVRTGAFVCEVAPGAQVIVVYAPDGNPSQPVAVETDEEKI